MKIITPALALFAALMATSSALGQAPYAKPVQEFSSDRDPAATGMPVHGVGSRWLNAKPALLDEPQGPPIGVEVYAQSGFSLPVGAPGIRDLLGTDMETGFVVQGGLRTLFFNEATTRAWVVDVSLSHYSNGHNRNVEYPLRVLDFTGGIDANGQPEVKLLQFGTPIRPGVKIRDTDRSYVNIGVGKDYFLFGGSAETDGANWRFGWDLGGRYGTLSQEYDAIKHRTDVVGGVYGGAHAGVNVPSRWGVLTFGTRFEWGYTWSDILQRASDIQELNFLLNLGVRY